MEELFLNMHERTYGHLALAGGKWRITAEPHVMMMMKRVFSGLANQFSTLMISHNEANAELIEWVMMRYPLEVSAGDLEVLRAATASARNRRQACERILVGAAALDIATRIPLRPYQAQAVALLCSRRALLCGDDLGLGKTSIALGAIAAGLQPAIVVCKTHLQQQWVSEAAKFLDGVQAHVVKKMSAYDLPRHNLLVITYSKLWGWAEFLKGYQLIAFDEMQELRIAGSRKYSAAAALCDKTPHRLGLTATPVYNYGDEIFNLINLLEEGSLGTRGEFLREWCVPHGDHYAVQHPSALGSFLAENHLFLRRRRQEVGRELPPVTRVAEEVEYHKESLLDQEDKALELAKAVLRGTWTERGKAALELDAMLRMQTGIAKAPFVADFVRQLVESGERVVLVGWHREVYAVWQRAFDRHAVRSRLYTGSETPAQKAEAVREFVAGTAPVLILSLRSGEGLNGLQEVSSVIVFGELDWSPQVHEQCIGRLNRDGQQTGVTAVYLYAAGGSDPVIAGTLGVKKAQSEGIINPADAANSRPLFAEQAPAARAAALAKQILSRHKETAAMEPSTPTH